MPHLRAIRVFAFQALGVLFGAAVGLLTPASASAQELVRVQDYPGLGNLMLRVAIANKTCEKHGIKCEQRVIPAAPLGLQTMLAGDIEVAFGPPEVVIQAASKGADVRILGNGARGAIFFLVAGNHLETPSAAKGYPAVMQDFKGKKIGVTARGSGAEFQLVDLLKGAGMSAADITMVAVGAPNTALPALVNKQVDAVMAFEPMGGFCEVLKSCRIVVNMRNGEGPADLLAVADAGSVLTVRTDLIQKRPKAVAGFIAAMKETEVFMQNPANYDAVLKVSQDSFKIDIPKGPDVVANVLKNSLPAYRFAMEPKAVQAAANYLLASKQLEAAQDTSRLIYTAR
jgi:NitT/TauT family transport system substrate-binding protein